MWLKGMIGGHGQFAAERASCMNAAAYSREHVRHTCTISYLDSFFYPKPSFQRGTYYIERGVVMKVDEGLRIIISLAACFDDRQV